MNARILFAIAALAIGVAVWPAAAQYPKVPKEVQRAEDERRAAYEKPEDEAWENAQPELAEWAKKGKPYIPWAAKPSDLPQADIKTTHSKPRVFFIARPSGVIAFRWQFFPPCPGLLPAVGERPG